MNKQTILSVLIALFPSYSALFASSTYASLILCITTFIGFVITGVLSDDEPSLRDKIRLAWVLHLIGIFVVIAFHNLG